MNDVLHLIIAATPAIIATGCMLMLAGAAMVLLLSPMRQSNKPNLLIMIPAGCFVSTGFILVLLGGVGYGLLLIDMSPK